MTITNPNITLKTLKVRVRDKHTKSLQRKASSVNFVWNYINELSHRFISEKNKFLSAYDIDKYTKGSSTELNILNHTIQEIARWYVKSRKQSKKKKLSWRKTKGTRRSLGWIPLKSKDSKWKNGQIYVNGEYFKVWDSYGLSQYKWKNASFNEDSRGRWYFNVTVEVEKKQSKGTSSVGIDLGCKDAATTSDGDKLSGRWYRHHEEKLKKAQRANKKKEVKNIHAKIKNKRKDEMHKFSRKIVDNNAAVFVGNVNAKAFAQTKMSKSSLDAGWGMFKTMLEYKCAYAGVVFEEVNEAYTTQSCSECGCISGPKGYSGLNERSWQCDECGAHHDRDVNAAVNIRAVGHYRLGEGISK